jgi:acetyltransferase-like isoleucine patch superfamily enzyme
VIILTSSHSETPPPAPVMDAPLELASVEVGDGSDIGVGAILLPGARVGRGAQIAAGAVVTGEIPEGVVALGMPARACRRRGERPRSKLSD